MFLHVGNAQIIFNRELIGIFNLNIEDNPANKEFLDSAMDKTANLWSPNDRPKSFIVTDGRVLISPISPRTLFKRQKAHP